MTLTQAQIAALKLIDPLFTVYTHYDLDVIQYNNWTIYSRYGTQRKWRKVAYIGKNINDKQNQIFDIIGANNVAKL